jgi:hypothetical protein
VNTLEIMTKGTACPCGTPLPWHLARMEAPWTCVCTRGYMLVDGNYHLTRDIPQPADEEAAARATCERVVNFKRLYDTER